MISKDQRVSIARFWCKWNLYAPEFPSLLDSSHPAGELIFWHKAATGADRRWFCVCKEGISKRIVKLESYFWKTSFKCPSETYTLTYDSRWYECILYSSSLMALHSCMTLCISVSVLHQHFLLQFFSSPPQHRVLSVPYCTGISESILPFLKEHFTVLCLKKAFPVSSDLFLDYCCIPAPTARALILYDFICWGVFKELIICLLALQILRVACLSHCSSFQTALLREIYAARN